MHALLDIRRWQLAIACWDAVGQTLAAMQRRSRRHISPQYVLSAAKRPAVASKILGDFFLMEEKRAIRTPIFQDLLEYEASG
jgi:hypothetical protein